MRILLTVPALFSLSALASPTPLYYAVEKGVGELLLEASDVGNGPCADGTRVRTRSNSVQLICYGFNATTQDVTFTLVKSKLGYHARSCVVFQDTKITYPLTLPTPLFYHKRSGVGQSVDLASKDFANIRDVKTVFDADLTCAEYPVDFVKPLKKEI